MKFLTGYVWPDHAEAEERASMLLQQVQFDRHSMVLAAIGGGNVENGAVGSLKNWFQGEGVMKCARPETDRIKRILTKLLERCWEDGPFVGILIVEEAFWFMTRNGGCAYLLNRRFQRTHVKKLCLWNEAQNIGYPQEKGFQITKGDPGKDKGWRIAEGTLEKGLGILLGSPMFYQGVSRDGMKQCLASQELHRERQIESRLQELAEEGERQSAQRGCAIYIRTA